MPPRLDWKLMKRSLNSKLIEFLPPRLSLRCCSMTWGPYRFLLRCKNSTLNDSLWSQRSLLFASFLHSQRSSFKVNIWGINKNILWSASLPFCRADLLCIRCLLLPTHSGNVFMQQQRHKLFPIAASTTHDPTHRRFSLIIHCKTDVHFKPFPCSSSVAPLSVGQRRNANKLNYLCMFDVNIKMSSLKCS